MYCTVQLKSARMSYCFPRNQSAIDMKSLCFLKRNTFCWWTALLSGQPKSVNTRQHHLPSSLILSRLLSSFIRTARHTKKQPPASAIAVDVPRGASQPDLGDRLCTPATCLASSRAPCAFDPDDHLCLQLQLTITTAHRSSRLTPIHSRSHASIRAGASCRNFLCRSIHQRQVVCLQVCSRQQWRPTS